MVFAPKYRRKIIYKELKRDIGAILRKICNELKLEIIAAEACPDHIHIVSKLTTIYERITICSDTQK